MNFSELNNQIAALKIKEARQNLISQYQADLEKEEDQIWEDMLTEFQRSYDEIEAQSDEWDFE